MHSNDARYIVPASIFTGLATATALSPFDFVRGTVGAFRPAPSTVAFSTVAFSVFFTQRKVGDKFDRGVYAVAAAGLGAACEVPLDKAKLALAGGSMARSYALTMARVPLGAAMFFAFDHALTPK